MEFRRVLLRSQHKKIADAEEELIVLQREAEKADVQYYPDPQKAMKEQYRSQKINDKNDKIAAKRKEMCVLKQQPSDMEDDRQRTGGDAGWARSRFFPTNLACPPRR